MRLFSKLLCLAAVTTATLVAKADSIDGFTLTEFGHTITWLLPSSPTPADSSSPHFFTLDDVPVYYDGVLAMADYIQFSITSFGGGVVVDIAGVDFNGLPEIGRAHV